MKLLPALLAIGSNALTLTVSRTKCYVQGVDSLPMIQGIQYHGAEVNMSNCLGFCLRRGFFTFGVDARDLCLCGNEIDPNAQEVRKSDCNDTCKGDESQPCGGLRRVRAAQVNIDDSIVPEFRRRRSIVTDSIDEDAIAALVHELHEEIILEKPGSSTRPNSDMVPIPEDPEEDILAIISHEDFETEIM